MLLPLCAVLTGNDYGAPKGAETLLSLLDVNVSTRGGGKGRGNASRIERLLNWLSSFSSPAEALEEVNRLMGDGLKDGSRLSSQLLVGMQEYHLTPQSSLARWFSGGKASPRGWIPGLPECLSLAAVHGLLAPLVIDAVVMRRVLLIPQVENSKLASSHRCARALRQAVYGILLLSGNDAPTQVHESINQGARGGRKGRGRGLGGGQGMYIPAQRGVNVAESAATVQAQGPSAPVCVEEYDRLDLNFKKNQVEAHPPRSPLRLDTIGQVKTVTKILCNYF